MIPDMTFVATLGLTSAAPLLSTTSEARCSRTVLPVIFIRPCADGAVSAVYVFARDKPKAKAAGVS